MELADIPRLLKERGLSQTRLAAEVGVSQAYLWQMIHSQRPMSLDVFKRIEAVLTRAESSQGASARARESYEAEPGRIMRSVTLAEARAMKANPPPPLPDEEKERLMAEIRELATALRSLPRITDMTDDEILGYDEPDA